MELGKLMREHVFLNFQADVGGLKVIIQGLIYLYTI